MPQPTIVHSVPSAAAIAALVGATYDLAPIAACKFLRLGFNDTYSVTIATGECFFLRLSVLRHRPQLHAEIAAETAFLAYLSAAGVPVATAVATREGALFAAADFPEGSRPFVLFRQAEGRMPDGDASADARAQGLTLARLHVAAETYPGRQEGYQDGARSLDLDHLLHRPMQAILALGLDAPRVLEDLAALETRLAAAVGHLAPRLTRTRCHGDVHGFNARIAESGPHAGRAVFFDFDEGGEGCLAYDLAVYLWAQTFFGRQRYGMWHAFEAGYCSLRPLEAADEAAIPVFAAIRLIWMMGEAAAGTPRCGLEHLPLSWLEKQVAFLLEWERDQLAPRLL